MSDVPDSATNVVRRAVLTIDPTYTLRVVDGLDLRAHAKVSAVVGVPLRQLQQRRDVVAFATTAPPAALRALIELMALAPLERIVTLLGDHAESPTFDELEAALDALVAAGSTRDDALAVLSFAVCEAFPAAPHCRRILAERAEFALAPLPEVAVTSPLAPPHEVTPEVREQRRLRRDEEKRRRKANATGRPPRGAKPKSLAPPVPSAAVAAPATLAVAGRRPVILTPLERSRVDPEHPLVGTVIVVDVPFDAHDPVRSEVASKERPAVVVAASELELLVRPIYSHPSPTRSVFTPWRRVGLDHVSYIDVSRVGVARSDSSALHQLGRLTTSEWNALT